MGVMVETLLMMINGKVILTILKVGGPNLNAHLPDDYVDDVYALLAWTMMHEGMCDRLESQQPQVMNYF